MKRVHRSGRKYPRNAKNWIRQRDDAYARAGGLCEVTAEFLFSTIHGEDCDGSGWNCDDFDTGYCRTHWNRACHHIIAERFVRTFFKGVDPHILDNLCVVTPGLHTKLTNAENKLFTADWLGYRTE